MDFSNPALVATYSVGAFLLLWITLAKAVVPIWRGFARLSSRVTGALDNLGGREPFVDNATGKLVPAIPPLGERLTRIEDTLVSLANVNGRLDKHEAKLNEHDSAIAALIGTTFERGAETALKAVEQKTAGVIDVDPEP